MNSIERTKISQLSVDYPQYFPGFTSDGDISVLGIGDSWQQAAADALDMLWQDRAFCESQNAKSTGDLIDEQIATFSHTEHPEISRFWDQAEGVESDDIPQCYVAIEIWLNTRC